MAARKEKNRVAQIELYPLLGQQGLLDSPSKGSDSQRFRTRRHRFFGGKPGRRCRADQTVSNEEADLELRPGAN